MSLGWSNQEGSDDCDVTQNLYPIAVGKPEKIPLRRPGSSWEDNIKMDVKEIIYENGDLIYLVQDREQW